LNWFLDALPPGHLQSDHLDLRSHIACLLITPFFFPRAVPCDSDACCCFLCH
jgi:hypothetical protein